MIRSLLVLCLLLGAVMPATAQRVEHSPWASATTRPTLLAPALAPGGASVDARATGRLHLAATAPAPQPAPRPTVRGSAPLRIAHVLGGAIVGAGVGYFTSQMVMSSWNDRSRSESGAGMRRSYTISGATLGALTGLWTGRTRVHQLAAENGAPAGDAANLGASERGSGRNVLTLDELREDASASVYQVIQKRRPAWLNARGLSSFREGSGELPQILVYRDGFRVGDVESLREVPASTLVEVRYYDAAAATYRFGIGNIHGAIELLTHH